MPVIEGASREQRQILLEVFAGLGSEEIRSVSVRPYEPRFEDEADRTPGPYGDAVVVEFAAESRRAEWEATLLAYAFGRRSAAAGLPKVAWFQSPKGGHTLGYAEPSVEPLGVGEVDGFREAIAAAAREAALERFDVLQPEGHAFALTFRVNEPHAFLRFHSRAFLGTAERWRNRFDGIYIEIRDAEPDPVLRVGWHRHGGFSGSRRDVACCAPMLGLGWPDMPPPPDCPIFG